MRMICDHAKGCKASSCPDIVKHFKNARCNPQKCYELEAQVACVPVPSKPVYGGFHLCGKCLQPIADGEAEHKHPELSKPKEEFIEGLAEWLKNNRRRYPSPTWKDIAGCLLVYLSSHGFGDIEQAKREERERITHLQKAAEKVVKEHNLFIFEELSEALGNTNTRILKDAIENLRGTLEALKQEGK